VISYCDNLRADPDAFPENYWSNTSSNSIVRRLIRRSDRPTQKEIERLIAGETIKKEIRQDLTYNEIDDNTENLWSVLFATGYLTQRGRESTKVFQLAIPNREIRELFTDQVWAWFKEASRKDTHKLDAFCEAFPAGDAETIERLFNDYLWNTISIRDTAAQKERKEHFYHGILLGLLSHKGNWMVQSNVESGEGYSDICVQVEEGRVGVVIEVKYAEGDRLDAACVEALKQIENKQYEAYLLGEGMKSIRKFGIACYKKHCKVVMAQ
jgi:Holliday junction resolvase-like predicted endonuclease